MPVEEAEQDSSTTYNVAMAVTIIVAAEPHLRNLLLAIFDEVGNAVRVREVEVAMRSRRLGEAFARSQSRTIEGLMLPQVHRVVENVVMEAVPTAMPMNRRRLLTVSSAAAEHAKRFSARHVSGVTKETMLAIRNIVAYGMIHGQNPRMIAGNLRDQIGLTARHQQAVQNQRTAMMKAEQPLPKSQIDATNRMYAQRLRENRAQMIARTEVVNALNVGRLKVWREGQKIGEIPHDARKRWVTAEDERTCPVCEPMHDTIVGLNEPFNVLIKKDERITLDGPPPHPQCRCIVDLVTG